MASPFIECIERGDLDELRKHFYEASDPMRQRIIFDMLIYLIEEGRRSREWKATGL